MIKYLIKSTNEYRVETKEDADTLHKEIEEEAANNGWTLSGWAETYKNRKASGEIVDEWYICKSTVIFNDPKEPECPINNIEYNVVNISTIPFEQTEDSAF